MNKYGQLAKKIKIHSTFWLISSLAIITGYFWELLGLFFIVFTHEMGHAAAAQHFKWKIKRILILPFGGFCEVDEHGNRTFKQELIVILAGPIQHLLIGLLIFLLNWASIITVEYAQQLYFFNMMILTFNLLPIWPLDGGKLIQLYYSARKPFIEAFRASLLSSIMALSLLHIFIFFYAPFNINIWVVLVYLSLNIWTAWKQQKYHFLRFLMERHYGQELGFQDLKTIDAKEDDSLHDILQQFKRGYKHLIYVRDSQSYKKKLDENELLHAYFTEKRVSAKLKELVYEE